MPSPRLFQVQTHNATFGLVFSHTSDGWKCVRSAPIGRRLFLGSSIEEAQKTAYRKGYSLREIPTTGST